MDMFLEEWQAERGQRPLHSIAIVDEYRVINNQAGIRRDFAGGLCCPNAGATYEKQLKVENEIVDLKLDLRQYVYRGQGGLTSVHLYQGQTINFAHPAAVLLRL